MSGPLFVDSIGGLTTPGVGAVDVQAPVVIAGVPNGKIAIAAQFEWGPINVVYQPVDTSDFLNTYAPPGSARQSSGYRALMRRKGLALAVCRALHSDAVKASVSLAATGGAVAATGKYEGTAGNNLQLLMEASSDGVAANRKFTVYWTDPVTGTYKEVIADNVAPPNSVPITIDVTQSKLLSAFSVATAITAFPAAPSTTAFTSGANGTAIAAIDYTNGFDALDLIDGISVMLADDCGSSLRNAVNSSLLTHGTAAAGRYEVFLQGDPANAWAAVKTDKTGYAQSKWMVYFASWVYVPDDAGTLQLTPSSTFAASAIINLDPVQSHAWASTIATKYYDAINSVYTALFNPAATSIQADAMNLGIQIIQKEPTGGFSFAHDRNSVMTVADRYNVTSRLRRFFALSLVGGLREFRNAPNIQSVSNDVIKAVKQFFDSQLPDRAGRCVSYVIDAKSNNTQASTAQGFFIVAIDAMTPAPMERIALLMKVGPTVTVETPTS